MPSVIILEKDNHFLMPVIGESNDEKTNFEYKKDFFIKFTIS